MATRRMRIKATINVPRGGIKTETQELPTPSPVPVSAPAETSNVPLSPSPVVPLSPRICSGAVSPAPATMPPHQDPLDKPMSPITPTRACTPPVSTVDRIPSSPKSPSPSPWQCVQRPSPSKSPVGLPPSGSVIRRSPSPALSRLTNSPGPPVHYPTSPVKSPVPSYTAPHSPIKYLGRTPVVVMPTSTVSISGVVRSTPISGDVYQEPSSPGPSSDINVKSPVSYLFRPPPSPSPSYQDFHSVKSPSSGIVVSRPSPAQSPVYGISRPSSTSSANFLTHHLNSNSNSADSHEVAYLMGASSMPSFQTGGLGQYPPSPEKRPHSSNSRDSTSSRGSHGGGQGAFSSVSSNVNPSPSFAKTMFENPESLKKRSDDIRKKEGAIPNPTKFATARKEFFDKLQSGQAPERSKLTMLHFTFYNPPNPDGSSKLSLGKRIARSRASSVCSDTSSIVKLEKEGKNDENTAGKANSAPSSIAGSRRTTASSVGSGGSCAVSEAGSVASNESSGSMPGPRVKVGPDGQLIIDEKSLVVETSEAQRARQQIEDMEVVSGAEYAVGSSGFYRYKKNYRRGQDWTERETIRFYRALNQCGTDFSMMLNLFPHRSRQELKAKFKREDRRNPDMISKALASCIFDPDEGISSDEEISQINGKGTEKEKLLNEEKEVEEVICSAEDPQDKKMKKSKADKKKKTFEFSAIQMQELKTVKSVTKGSGTGKGRKWNTPVEGLEGGKLLPPKKAAGPPLPFQPISKIKEEVTIPSEEKPKRKYTRRKKQTSKDNNGGDDSTHVTTRPGPTPGTVSIVISSGVISTPSENTSIGLAEVKKEIPDSTSPQQQKGTADTTVKHDTETSTGGSKRRSRLPKTKPNLKRGGSSTQTTAVDSHVGESKSGNISSQATNKIGMCVDFFSFEANDPIALKSMPAPLPVVQETFLDGNEEGSDSLVIVDLDELNSIQRESDNNIPTYSSPKKITPPPKKRKNNSNSTDGTLPVTTVPVIVSSSGDPFGKSVMTAPSSSTATNKEPAINSSSVGGSQPNKKVKVLPYRVPGPGGTLPATRRVSLADELEIEIEMNTTSNES